MNLVDKLEAEKQLCKELATKRKELITAIESLQDDRQALEQSINFSNILMFNLILDNTATQQNTLPQQQCNDNNILLQNIEKYEKINEYYKKQLKQLERQAEELQSKIYFLIQLLNTDHNSYKNNQQEQQK